MRSLMDNSETAAFLSIKPQTLRKWRTTGKGPLYIRLGGPRGRVAYRAGDVEEWLAANTFANTAEETVASTGDHARERTVR